MILNALILGKLWQMRQEQRDPDTDLVIASLFMQSLLVIAVWPLLILVPMDGAGISRKVSMPVVITSGLLLLLGAWPIYLLFGIIASVLCMGLIAIIIQDQKD